MGSRPSDSDITGSVPSNRAVFNDATTHVDILSESARKGGAPNDNSSGDASTKNGMPNGASSIGAPYDTTIDSKAIPGDVSRNHGTSDSSDHDAELPGSGATPVAMMVSGGSRSSLSMAVLGLFGLALV